MPDEYKKKKVMSEKEPKEDSKEDMAEDKKEEGKPVGPDDYTELATQCKNEWDVAWKHQEPEKEEARRRLKVFNNQRKDKTAVGDTTMFTVFWTVFASLYDDRLAVEHNGREEGDEETASNLDAMAQFDYEEMQKDKVDFDWIWDACFFGRGLLEMEEYRREPDSNEFYPLPRVLDPLTFLRDPDATSVNGRDKRRTGAAKFMGYECYMTKDQMKENEWLFGSVKNGDMSDMSQKPSTKSLLDLATQARNEAQNFSDVAKEISLGVNQGYVVTVWYTRYRIGGELHNVKVWLTNERSKVIGIKVLKDHWNIIDRALYPHSHDWRGTSIPDLTEDKQRARAVALNLGLDAMKSDLNPMYIFDTNQVTNRKDLSFGFNKFIPVDAKDRNVNNAIVPLNKANPNLNLVNFILTTLDQSAQKATATPDIQQGMQSQADRPLGETNIIAARVDTRYSLSAKIFGWSEKEFWRQWYWMYKEYFADGIDEKIVRIVGAFGPKWRPLEKKDIICRIDPDISIESKAVSRSKAIDERRGFSEYLTLAIQDPTVNRRYGLKKLGKLFGLQKDELDRLFPMTIDERMQEQENDKLNRNEYVEIQVEDDHNVHLEILAKAKETPATKAHRIAHEQALLLKKTRPDLFPQDENSADYQQNDMKEVPPGAGAIGPKRPTTPSMAPGGE